MKAITYTQYGTPDVLQFKEVEQPTPGDGEVLIHIQAASVNSWDWDLVTGGPPLYRLLFGLRKPKHPIIGSDIAGRVAAVGRSTRRFQPGDAVFGDISGSGFGAFAEYMSAAEDVLALKPDSMTFAQAAAIPQAAFLALQGLRQGQIQPGKKVLINGAGGGVGTFAVQLAHSFGADVTAVDSPGKFDMLRSLGVDQVIDYTQTDFAQTGQQYDLILDVVAARSIFAYRRALRPGGILVIVGGSIPTVLRVVTLGALVSKTGDKKMGLLLYKPDPDDLDFIKALFASGKVVPVIDRCYPLSETAEALRYFGTGQVRGKIVITVKDNVP